jgi:hypothetical protein
MSIEKLKHTIEAMENMLHTSTSNKDKVGIMARIHELQCEMDVLKKNFHSTVEMNFDQFIEQYKPLVQERPFNENEISITNLYIEDYKNPLIGIFREKLPNQIWTVCEIEGQMMVQSGWHFVNRYAYILTEIPFETDVLVLDEVVEYSIEMTIGTRVDATQDIEDILDQMFETLHEDFYIVTREGSTEGVEMEGSELEYFVFKGSIFTYKDDQHPGASDFIQGRLLELAEQYMFIQHLIIKVEQI